MLAWPLLGEVPGPWRWAGTVLGLGGTVLVVVPTLLASWPKPWRNATWLLAGVGLAATLGYYAVVSTPLLRERLAAEKFYPANFAGWETLETAVREELAALPPLDNDQGDQDQNQGGHEVPQAPPRRMGLSAILSNVSNAIVGALIMPGISYAMGEALRLVLPKAWTTVGPRNPWSRYGMVGRPGLLQQQWGRSLVGGCLYVVLKDVVRVYTKSRRVAAMGNRRVKNVDRRRRDK